MSPATTRVLTALTDALADGSVEVVDLTARLSSETPVIQLPPEFGQTARFELEEISAYDDRAPAWYWNNFRTGEHTGTHFDAPNHWVTGKGGLDVASIPVGHLIRPGRRCWTSAPSAPRTPTSCSRSTTSAPGSRSTRRCPKGGWLLYRTGWDARSDSQERFTTPTRPAHTRPG